MTLLVFLLPRVVILFRELYNPPKIVSLHFFIVRSLLFVGTVTVVLIINRNRC